MRTVSKFLPKAMLSILVVGLSALITIILHAVLPAKVAESSLDGWLVLRYGFPVVAIGYFLVLFAQCAAVVALSRNKLLRPSPRSGINFGLAFALLYMVGMQEIVLGGTPYARWGLDFVSYQALMGIGDAIPVLVLCALIGKIFFRGQGIDGATKKGRGVLTVLTFMAVVGTVRLMASRSGIIESYILDYPVPVAVWGYILGVAFGMAYSLVGSTTIARVKTMIWGIGVNWMIFNSFIGLIRKDAMADSLLRGAIDVASMAVAMGVSALIIP